MTADPNPAFSDTHWRAVADGTIPYLPDAPGDGPESSRQPPLLNRVAVKEPE